MNVWLFNNYNMLPQYGGLNRHWYFAKELAAMGHRATVFVGSHPHNTDLQLIEGKELWQTAQEAPFRWVHVKTLNYAGSRMKQVLSMFQYYRNGKAAANALAAEGEVPNAILGSSAHPLAAVLAIRLAKRFGCKSIVEIRDLWPESIVAYGIAGPKNPAVLALRRLEKWIYKKADAVVFTMEGAYDYIVEQGWEQDIPREKVHYINNGVDLEQFDYNREHYTVDDPDLDDPDTFKVVYTGSIRPANNPELLIDCAEKLQNYPNIRILAYGGGENLEGLRQTCHLRGITNCIFKGPIPKREIPYVLSKSDLNLLNYDFRSIHVYRYGSSQNKLFDYMASGHPILSNVAIAYSLLQKYQCGKDDTLPDSNTYAQAILRLYHMSEEEYLAMGCNARRAAEEYDFKKLTQKLIQVVESIPEKRK